MPSRLRLRLQPLGPIPGPFEHMSGLRALAYAWLEATNAVAVRTFHEEQQPGCLTFSPLRPTPDGAVMLEVTALTDLAEEMLAHGLPRVARAQPELQLGSTRFHYRLRNTLSGRVSYEDMARKEFFGDCFLFHLTSPTATHVPSLDRSTRTPRKSNPLPDPSWYFRNWSRRWNRFAPESLRIDAELLGATVDQRVAVCHLEGGTETEWLHEARTRKEARGGNSRDGGMHADPSHGPRAKRFIRRPFIGFVGTVMFRILEPAGVPAEVRRSLATLARFATFAGTGVETLRGMGQTVGLNDIPSMTLLPARQVLALSR